MESITRPREKSGQDTRGILHKFAEPDHKAGARMLLYALTLHDAETWFAASAVWAARLTPSERAALAYAAIEAVAPGDMHHVLDVAFDEGHDLVPPLFSAREEAELLGGYAPRRA